MRFLLERLRALRTPYHMLQFRTREPRPRLRLQHTTVIQAMRQLRSKAEREMQQRRTR
jgi:hypothetical protein